MDSTFRNVSDGRNVRRLVGIVFVSCEFEDIICVIIVGVLEN